MKRLATIATLLLVAALTACTPPYRQTFNDEGKSRGWTQKQTDAAYAYADRVFWSRQVGENKYLIVYGKVPTAKVRQQLEGVLKDLDAGLDPKNEEMRQYLSTFNLRKDVEHDEEVAEAIYDRVRASELQTEFNQKMGDTPESGPEAEMAQGYSIRKIYVNKPMAEAFPFTADVIEAAKKNGTLKPISHVTLDMSSEFDHKASNPSNPEDGNDFIWKAKKEAIDLTEYKIVDVDKPQDNRGSYLEGYRIIDGKRESKPALKVFYPAYGSIALVDTDEEGQSGFGVPNVIRELSSDVDAVEIARNGSLLDELFSKKEAKKDRTVPEAKLFKIEIAPLGGPVDVWQKSPDANGWIVPFKYVNLQGDNYNVRIKFKKPQIDPANPGYPDGSHAHSLYFEIEYIEKEYTRSGDRYSASAGQVLEYYHVKDKYAGKLKAKVLDEEDTKMIAFTWDDGSVEQGFVTSGKNKFIEEEPFAKSYTEGQKRWMIQKSDGSKVYDKRKSVGPPKEQTGEYDTDAMEEAMRPASSRGDMPSMVRKPQLP